MVGQNRTAERSAATDRVVGVGVMMFAESGFLATSIRDITKACGMTAAGFYSHFGSKEELLYTIISEANGKLERKLDTLELDKLASDDRLDAVVRTLVTFNLSYPREARVANYEYHFLQGSMREDVVRHRRRVRAMFEDAVQVKYASGLLTIAAGPGGQGKALHDFQRMEIRLLTMSIINLTIASIDWYHPDGLLSIAQVADAYCKLARRMAGQ
jgi:AcrR family transcriptional regulator